MRKYFLLLFIIVSVVYCQAQVKVYVKFTPYANGPTVLDESSTEVKHQGEIPLTTFSDNDEQTLNIGSQSTGAGAGKITFNPVTFSKPVGANSPQFFKLMAAGTAFQTVEFTFYNSNDQKLFKETLGLVAFKSIQRVAASCSGNCPGIIENYTMEYGGKNLTVYTINTATGAPGPSYSFGWNRVRNVAWDNPSVVIK